MQNEAKGNSKSVEDAVFDSKATDEFFTQMADKVDGDIVKDSVGTEEATPQQDPQQAVSKDDNLTAELETTKKRYSDSTREAQRMKAELDNLKPFVPVLEAMKNDSGLVEHVRDYLKNGGKPAQTIQEALELPEDFMFDAHEAMTDPNSDSAKVMGAQIDQMVNGRVNEALAQERTKVVQAQKTFARSKEEEAFKQKHNMNDVEFDELMTKAKTHVLSLEDVYLLVNKDKANANVANSAKADMLNQMKNVRNIPTSAGGSNNAGNKGGKDDAVFEALKGLDSGLDNMFGD